MTAIDAAAAGRIRAITRLLGPDVAAKARQTAAWQRDVPRGCACPWTWQGDQWERNPAATCGIHSVGDLLAAEVVS